MVNSIILCLIYLAICFYGLKLKEVVLALCFAYIGYSISNIILTPFIENPSLLLVICIGVGLLLGLFSTKLYKFTSFMLCFLLTFLICDALIAHEILRYVLGIGLGLVMGYLGIKFLKTFIIILTSVCGSIRFVDELNTLVSLNSNIVLLLIMIALAALGISYQFNTNKDF